MFQSIRSSQIALRIGLALVFMWLGIDTFITPQSSNVIFLVGIFEVLVAISLASGFFMRIFAVMAGVFLVIISLKSGVAAVDGIAHNVGLIGGLVALVLWPQRTYI